MTDGELLKRYVAAGDRRAIEELIRRHADLVYAAAWRQTGDAHQAEDVTQTVFLLLARKAADVPCERLAGWLFRVTRYAAANARRLATRRAFHERRAALRKAESVMTDQTPEPNPLLPLLDDALAKLPAADRDVVIMRYLQGKSVAEVSAAVGASEIAIRKRLERAIEKLRKFFTRRSGSTVDAPAVVALTAAAMAVQAPSEVITGAVGVVVGGTAPPTVLSISKGVAMTMAWAKAKIAAAAMGLMLLVGGGGAALLHAVESAPARDAAPVSATAPPTQPVDAGIDPQTLELLNTIISGRRRNRAAIEDLHLKGREVWESNTAEMPNFRKVIAFEYWQLGGLRRVDNSYPEEKDPNRSEFKSVYRQGFVGDQQIVFFTGNEKNAPQAQIFAFDGGDGFTSDDPLRVLEGVPRARPWKDFAGYLEYLLNRGWQADKETFRVQSVVDAGRDVLKVSYGSLRGSKSGFDAFVDPKRGFELIRYGSHVYYPEGALASQTTGEFTIQEIAPGLWRATNGTVEDVQWNKDGTVKGTARRTVEVDEISANSGEVRQSDFTFEEMGVAEGTEVNDYTLPLKYEFRRGHGDANRSVP